MNRLLVLVAIVLLFVAAPAWAGGLSGQYLEARTADVYTGPCFANSDMNLAGSNAVLAWKVDKGSLDDICLDGLGVVAVVAASDTLGLKQTGAARAVLIVDERATEAQRAALIRLAKRQAGDLVADVKRVETAAIDLDVGSCKDGGCARLNAGTARIATRCIDPQHDKHCGNEVAFYPPLSPCVKASCAVATEHAFTGKGLNQNWKDGERRSAYIGAFEIR
jgi:hypothetical protein